MALCSRSWTDINVDFSNKSIAHCCKAVPEYFENFTESIINSSDDILQHRKESQNGIKHPQCNYCWNSKLAYRDIHNKPIDIELLMEQVNE